MSRLRGTITAWSPEKGHGTVTAGERRHFLHHRDFAVHHKRPEVGDVVTFALGQDAKGRPCAVAAEHTDAGGRVRSVDGVTVVCLGVLPAVAAVRLDPAHGLAFALGLYGLLSALAVALYWDDKRRARRDADRHPEFLLHLVEVLGGWPGAYVAQRLFRHKLTKLRYQVVFWVIVALHQTVALDALIDWRLLRAALASARSLLA